MTNRWHEIAALVDAEGAHGADLIALPETWNMQYKNQPEPLTRPDSHGDGGTRTEAPHLYCLPNRPARWRAAASIPRCSSTGLAALVTIYDKVYPYWSEYDLSPVVQPALAGPTVDPDGFWMRRHGGLF